MKKYAALISYIGTQYCGWQIQTRPDSGALPSIQGAVQEAIAQVCQEKVSVVGSGRTDSGVHAWGQVAHFCLEREDWDVGKLYKGLNSVLPRAIQLLSLQEVREDFHAQRSAEKKRYVYRIQTGDTPLPLYDSTSWWIRRPLDLEGMRRSLQGVLGSHDFKPFQASGAQEMRTTVREILEVDLVHTPVSEAPEGFGILKVSFTGTGFLKQMVRGLIGTLVQVGEGKRPADVFQSILESGNRPEVGPTAPAKGLWLEKVWYPEEFQLFRAPPSPQRDR